MYKDYLNTAIGTLEIICDQNYLKAINFVDRADNSNKNKVTAIVKEQLMEYFEGKREVFEINFEIEGTAFQKKVLKETINIPIGTTLTYKALAMKINNPNASRAVGNALNKNKIPIIIPCHRIIGTNGKLTGYAGGIDKKEYLLTLEKEKQGF